MTRNAGHKRLFNWKAGLGLGFSLALLVYALRDVDAGAVLAEIGRADPVLFTLAVTAATLTFALRALRWKPLLRPVRPGTGFRSRFAATTIGFMGNNLLPLRLGEFARAFALARAENLPVSASIGSLVVERLFDLCAVLACLFIAMAMPGFPAVSHLGELDTARLLIAFVIAAAALIGVVTAAGHWPDLAARVLDTLAGQWLPERMRRRLHDIAHSFLRGLASLREFGLILQVAAWSALVWFLGSLGFWLGFKAFDIHLPFSAALFLQAVVALAVSLPSAPGFFGLFQAGVRIGLVDVWAVELNKAMGFAIGFHIGGFIPVTVIGLIYVWRLGLSWQELKQSKEIVGDAIHDDLPAGSNDESPRTGP